MDITQSQGKSVGIPVGVPYMKVSVHKDNAGALILARNFPPKFTSSGKYYATNTIRFCEEINKSMVLLLKIATVEHLEDLFTKDIPIATLEYLQNEIMGC